MVADPYSKHMRVLPSHRYVSAALAPAHEYCRPPNMRRTKWWPSLGNDAQEAHAMVTSGHAAGGGAAFRRVGPSPRVPNSM
jgi:hypothetical protein